MSSSSILTLALEAESDDYTLTSSFRDAIEPSRCFGRGTGASNKAPTPPPKKSSFSSSNSKGMLPDTLPLLLSASNGDLTLCWISSLLILPDLLLLRPLPLPLRCSLPKLRFECMQTGVGGGPSRWRMRKTKAGYTHTPKAALTKQILRVGGDGVGGYWVCL